MKNLKKVLALVLAFACAFTMFASAAFTDEADFAIDSEVVDTLVSLGVINGYTDGSFQPDGTVTRAEMAKMIYVVRTGKSDASAYNNDTTTFTDISSHWARGYIKYCQALGVIAGKSSTIFDPDASVTTQEAAKMLLVTLGYDAEKAGLVGSGWGNRTTALADENGLLKDVDSGATSAAPRQYAAQLIYNTIFAPTVVLRDGEYTNQAYISSQNGVEFNATVGEKYMNLTKAKAGILLSVDQVEGKDYFKIETTGDTDGSNTSFDKVPTDVSDMIGQEIRVLVKDTKDTDKQTVYGVYTAEDSKVVASGYLANFKSVDSDTNKVKLNGTEYKLESNKTLSNTYAYYVNTNVYELSADVAPVALSTTKVSLDTLTKDAKVGSITADIAASEVKLIDNDGNGKVDRVIFFPVRAAKVTSVSSTGVTVKYLTGNTSETIKFDDADTYSGIAKDDYVTIFDDDFRSSDKIEIEKIDVTTGKVTSTRNGLHGEARVDGGDWMKIAYNVSELTTGSTYDLTIYGDVIIDADETAGSTDSVAYISFVKSAGEDALGDTETTVKARIYFQDGTNSTVEISKVDGKKVKTSGTGSDIVIDTTLKGMLTEKLVTYSKLSDGTYDVKAVSTSNKVGMDAYTSGATNAYNKQKISGTSVADDAVIFVKATSETKVLTGKQVNNWQDTISGVDVLGMLTKKSSGISYVKFAALEVSSSKVPGASKDTKYGYLTADPYQSSVDGEKKGTYEVWTGTETAVLYEDASTASLDKIAVSGDIISYTVNGNYIEDVTKTGTMVAITGYNADSLAYVMTDGTAKTYDFDDDCVFITVNDKDNEGTEGGKANLAEANEVADANDKTKTDYIPNAYVVLIKDGDDYEIAAVIFDTNKNELNVPTSSYIHVGHTA
jgi:hypothetical protein